MDRTSWPQSALTPDGPAAAAILELGWVLFGLSAIVVVLVAGTLFYAAVRRHEYPTRSTALPVSPDLARAIRGEPANPEASPVPVAPIETQAGAGIDGPAEIRTGPFGGDRRSVRWIVAGGVVFPILTLVPLFLLTLRTLAAVEARDQEPSLTIEVIGRQFWWEVHYLDTAGNRLFETANEIHIPVGQTVLVRLLAADVIHSFWVPRLAGKLDMIPGKTNQLRIRADQPGTYRGQCAEFCGLQHAKMAFLVIAEPAAEFRDWARNQALPAAEPPDSLAARGREVFLRTACRACHAIRGTPAEGPASGPDLTHLATRRTLAAVTLPNTPGHLGGWISDPQASKPGSRMPATPLGSEDFRALLRYLQALR